MQPQDLSPSRDLAHTASGVPAFCKTVDPVDVSVGSQLRLRRRQLGQSQSDLAAALGVSFQQVQKYERGANRVSASMMFHAAKAQGVHPSFYFEALDTLSEKPLDPAGLAAATWLASPDAWVLAEAVSQLPTAMRAAVLATARALGDAS